MYPSMVEPGAAIVKFLDSTCNEVLGAPPEHIYAPNAFDQGYLNHIGIPTVNWGPGEYNYAHTDLDMASVERVRDAARVFATLLISHLSEG